ncbi:unnamed protein product [Pleuronectes platessa]|uniref:Uncharacterized protein n=1 Tax=Pleuronectes platessa TaxID=8262 RepID=A0A9N7VG59_PLEPL|nr:unnamed protein product [Pleuronectes platessa]
MRKIEGLRKVEEGQGESGGNGVGSGGGGRGGKRKKGRMRDGEASHSLCTCPEDFPVLRKRRRGGGEGRSEDILISHCHSSHVHANCRPADRYHHHLQTADLLLLVFRLILKTSLAEDVGTFDSGSGGINNSACVLSEDVIGRSEVWTLYGGLSFITHPTASQGSRAEVDVKSDSPPPSLPPSLPPFLLLSVLFCLLV